MSTFDFDVIGDPVTPKVIPPSPARPATKTAASQATPSSAIEPPSARRHPDPVATPRSGRSQGVEGPPAG